jgi:hypothetical protein
MFPKFGHDGELTVTPSELVVATADYRDPMVDGKVGSILKSMRDHMKLDVVFVSEFVDGQRVLRFLDSTAGDFPYGPGDACPLESTFCQRIVDGRLPGVMNDAARMGPTFDVPPTPVPVGAHVGAPIVLKNGRVYGTLCSFSAAPNEELREHDLLVLRQCADMLANKLDTAAMA